MVIWPLASAAVATHWAVEVVSFELTSWHVVSSDPAATPFRVKAQWSMNSLPMSDSPLPELQLHLGGLGRVEAQDVVPGGRRVGAGDADADGGDCGNAPGRRRRSN